MPLVVVHLRWDDVDQDQYAALRAALPDGDGLPPGCLARTLRLQAGVLHGTEVWAGSDRAERALRDLPGTVSAAGLAAPTTVAFALPDVDAGSYRRPAPRPVAGRTAVVPGPRTAEHDSVVGGESLPAGDH
jgi:hypothetical protein